MKKLLSVLFVCVLMVASLSAQMMGPQRRHMPYSFGMMPQFAAPLYSWIGTLEYKDGYSYLRDKDITYLLVGVPKKEGLVLDTVPGSSTTTVQVWGVRLPTPKNEILVENLTINGIEQLLVPWWFIPLTN